MLSRVFGYVGVNFLPLLCQKLCSNALFVSMSTTTLAARPPDVRNLMVNMLPFSMTDEGLLALCSRYGEVLDCRVIKDRVTKEPRGYGFVTYTQVEAAQAAMQGLNGLEVGGQRLSVAPALGANSKKVAQYLAARESGAVSTSSFVPRNAPATQPPSATPSTVPLGLSVSDVSFGSANNFVSFQPISQPLPMPTGVPSVTVIPLAPGHLWSPVTASMSFAPPMWSPPPMSFMPPMLPPNHVGPLFVPRMM